MGIVEEVSDGEQGRTAYTTVGAWVNCPSCMALVWGIVISLWLVYFPDWPVHVLAIVGGAMLLGRWWMAQRVKARWWE